MSVSCDVSELLSWTSAAGIARSLYIHKSWRSGWRAVAGRIFLVLLLVVPLGLGLAELVLGLLYRDTPAGCPFPLPVWFIVDGSAALLTATLSLVDIARVAALSQDASDGDDDDEARSRKLGPYACFGLLIIFAIPLFRLLWVLFALDILYRIDPHSLSLFFSSSLNPGQCNATLFGFLVHYVEAATIIIALSLGALVAVFIAFCVRCGQGGGLRLNWCCRCGSCRDPGKSKEEQPFLSKRS